MTGAILAGGMSRRMGFNKALLKLNNETIIERTVRLFKEVFDETVIVANDPLLYEDLSTRIVTDIYKGAGSMGGIYTALFHCAPDNCYVFVAACDMPNLNKDAIQAVIKNADKKFDAVIPFVSGRAHPMHGLYSKGCLKPIESMIRQGNLKISELLDK
ncbi:MAG: molybdenum cofactor guanylyltransferase [Deltaproteobacteria bacterium]|nr:molybdenum cofactor guanylyltransferase [Deltaproteobacteria bacterium]